MGETNGLPSGEKKWPKEETKQRMKKTRGLGGKIDRSLAFSREATLEL